MSWLVGAMLLLSAIGGTFVVLSRDPKRQVFALSANGAVLGVLFFVLQAPDVALSEIVIGTAVTPFLFLVTLAAIASAKARS
jgi:energy-converting hydrogenase B subunit D